MGPCLWSCHFPGCGQGTDWFPRHGITALRKSCSHPIMVLSLLSMTLPGPTILPSLLPFFPHLLSWGAVSKGEEGSGQHWDHSSHASTVLLGGSVYVPCSTPATPEAEDWNKSMSNAAAATCLLGSARLEASGSHSREWRVVASPEPFGGRLSSYPSHLRPQQ